jgi:ATP phosphoribosyltransferase regulatory subunit
MEKYVRKNDGIEYMKQLSKLIDAYDLSQYVSFDFTLSSHMSYYTGMLFEVFASGSGFPLGNGGRYDGLLHLFGSDVGATGFSIRIDRLLEVLPKEEVEEETVCILFDDEDFIKALDLASTLREQGARVTVQSKKGLMNKEAFTKLFSRVVDLSQEEAQ